mgnify:CR=1 FL=1
MEHAKNVSVVLSDFDWSDLGTWGSLNEHLKKDENNNAIIGENVFLIDSENCLINMPDNKLVLIDGLKDYIVVESNNMLMILKNSNEQDLKKYLDNLKNAMQLIDEQLKVELPIHKQDIFLQIFFLYNR